MQAVDLIQREVVTCSDRDSLEHAAGLMWKYDIGCLPIQGSDRRVVGMLTDRDVCMAAYLQAAPLRSIAVSSVMSREVVTCRLSDELLVIEQAMRRHQIRRIPVVDELGELIGMITLNDIARAAHEGRTPSGGIATTLATITHPRLRHPGEG